MTSLCKGGHKFGLLHGKIINEYVDKTIDFLSNVIKRYSIQNSYQKHSKNNIRIIENKTYNKK